MMVYVQNCQQVVIPVQNAKLSLIIPIVVNNTIRLLIPIVAVNNCYWSEQLLHHFMEFTEEMQWDSDYLLHIGMYGPNVKLKFQEDLKRKFEETSKEIFLDTDTFTLHKAHTSFSKEDICKLPLDAD